MDGFTAFPANPPRQPTALQLCCCFGRAPGRRPGILTPLP